MLYQCWRDDGCAPRRRLRGNKDEYARSAWLGVAGTALAALSGVSAASCRCGTAAAPTPRAGAAQGTLASGALHDDPKAVAGAEPGLYERLRSFCELSAPVLQIICGVRDADDPAVAVVRRLQREFPDLDLQVGADATRHGKSNNIRLYLSRAVLTERYPAKPPSARQPADVTARGAPEQSDVADTAGRTS